MKKRIKKILSFIILLIGAILLLNFLLSNQINITGAFFGAKETTSLFHFSFAMIFLILGLILFSTSLTLEKIVISSSIKQHPSLLKLTKDAVKNPIIERELDHLVKELSKGNFEAGLGHPGHIEGTNIFYLRGRNGGRLYYRRIGKDEYDIVAKSAKGRNQEQVITQLKKIYS
jgi:hypothetical protein